MTSTIPIQRNRRLRQAIGLLLLSCLAISVLPMPRWLPAPAGKSQEDFPCRDRPCGCSTAEQCWKQCCCFNNCQKVAWAEQRQVQLPEYVIEAALEEAEREQQASVDAAPACPHCVVEEPAPSLPQKTVAASCCEKTQANSVCSPSDEAESDASCCLSGNAAAQQNHPEEEAPPQKNTSATESSDYVLGISVYECQGLTLLWQLLSMTTLPAVTTQLPQPMLQEWLACGHEIAGETASEPPEPPPRLEWMCSRMFAACC